MWTNQIFCKQNDVDQICKNRRKYMNFNLKEVICLTTLMSLWNVGYYNNKNTGWEGQRNGK